MSTTVSRRLDEWTGSRSRSSGHLSITRLTDEERLEGRQAPTDGVCAGAATNSSQLRRRPAADRPDVTERREMKENDTPAVQGPTNRSNPPNWRLELQASPKETLLVDLIHPTTDGLRMIKITAT